MSSDLGNIRSFHFDDTEISDCHWEYCSEKLPFVQLQKLFSYSGQVQDCVFSGANNAFAFVTLATPQVAQAFSTLLSVSFRNQ